MLKTLFIGNSFIEIQSNIQRQPKIGETLIGNSVNYQISGKLLNSCIQFSFLSEPKMRPSFFTVVGNDTNGNKIKEYLEKFNIDIGLLITDDKRATSTLISMHSNLDKGESKVLFPCNFTLEDINKYEKEIASFQVVVVNLEIPMDALNQILKIAHQSGAKTIVKASPSPENNNFDKSFLQYTSAIVLSEAEFASFGTVNSLFDAGVEVIVTTFGADGATFYEKGSHAGMSVATTVVKVVDPSGAGESFLGTFAYCLANKMSYEDASRIACGAATLSVQKKGIVSSFPKIGHPDLMPLF